MRISDWSSDVCSSDLVLTPIIVTLALFVFLSSWNDFMWPLIILADQRLYTLPVALAALSREHVQDNELMMAGAVVTTLPVLILFLALQRFRSEEHTSELQSLMRISYAVFCLKKQNTNHSTLITP